MKKSQIPDYLCPQARFINLSSKEPILLLSTESTLERFDDEEDLW